MPVIVAYTPYCKRVGWWNEHFNATRFGVPASDLSGLQAFEAPDPAYWCHHGYAVAVVDAAGTSHSGGDELFMGTASGRNVYDVIEQLAELSWCSGKVAMAGNSYLAMIQWAAAALRPPHLTAIAPWEGVIDVYREATVRRGIPDRKFQAKDIAAFIYGEHDTEDVPFMPNRAPLMCNYWADKRVALNRIEVPAYVVASWSSPLHTHGTLQAFREIGSRAKWLRVHNDQEWLDFADPANVDDLRKFFDFHVKGIANGWDKTPRVRLSVLDSGGKDIVGRAEDDWPLARQSWRTMYLDAANGALGEARPAEDCVAEYVGDDLASSTRFSHVAERDFEICGHSNLRLWVEAPDARDMDLFAAVYKDRQQHVLDQPVRAPQAAVQDRRLRASDAHPVGALRVAGVGRIEAAHARRPRARSGCKFVGGAPKVLAATVATDLAQFPALIQRLDIKAG